MIQCRNTSSGEIVFRKGLPQSDKGGGMGVFSIIKAASRYEGETDFSVQDGMFITRILLNLILQDCIYRGKEECVEDKND